MKEFLQKVLRLETLLWVLFGLAILGMVKSKYQPVELEVFYTGGAVDMHFHTFLVCTTLICLTYLKVNKPKE